MVAELDNRPFLVEQLTPDTSSIGSITTTQTQFSWPLTEDDEDRLTLLRASELYEGLDWREVFEPLT